ncbi:MAG: SprT-like domain-containing protein [Actinomycetota bacterium]
MDEEARAKKIFKRLNRIFFSNSLPTPIIEVSDEASYPACIFYPKIILSKNLGKRLPEKLLHEMIHYHLFLQGFGEEEMASSILGHSKRFKELARKFGLPT